MEGERLTQATTCAGRLPAHPGISSANSMQAARGWAVGGGGGVGAEGEWVANL
jgi:hypothetical protein